MISRTTHPNYHQRFNESRGETVNADVMFDTFKLSIELGNDAMQGGPDVARALREVADRIENGFEARGYIHDANGNTVGNYGPINKS